MHIPGLLLGTANFGLPYGIKNSFRQVEQEAAHKIMAESLDYRFLGIDTAKAYGDAEEVIGKLHNLSEFQIISTKISKVTGSPVQSIVSQIIESKSRFSRIPEIVYFHSLRLFKSIGGRNISELIDNLDSVQLGISLYSNDELREALSIDSRIKYFQVPLSILEIESRLFKSVMSLHADGINFAIRSVFKQGILLMKPWRSELSVLSDEERRVLVRFHEFCESEGVTPVQACLAFASNFLPFAQVVVGIDSPQQVRYVSDAYHSPVSLSTLPNFGQRDDMFDLRSSKFNKLK